MTDIRLLYVTTKDTSQARVIAETLLQQKLIACANILPSMESIYWWQGQIQNDSEAVLILKTQAHLAEAASAAILKLHSYETPCVLSLVVESGSEAYIKWLRDSTLGASAQK